MRIVTNAIPLLSPLTGVGKYTKSVILGLREQRPEFEHYYYYGYFTKRLHFERKRFYLLKRLLKKIPVVSTWMRMLKHQLGRLQLRNYDLYFEPNFIPCNIRANKTVTTIHDFSFHLNPEWHPEERVQYFSKNFFKYIGKADVLLTMSDFIAKEAHEIVRPRNSQIITIHEGYDGKIFNRNGNGEAGIKISGNYILFVGSIEPRKNLRNLLRAYLLLPESLRKEFKLLLVGARGWHNAEVLSLLEKMNGSVEYLGYVSDEHLASLYRGAACFVFPSFYEGFGLPPLEAMACGCPVVVSNKASLPEVCGDAALYVDPHRPDSIAEGMYNVLTDTALREGLAQKGLDRASQFSWDKTVRAHIELFEKILGHKSN